MYIYIMDNFSKLFSGSTEPKEFMDIPDAE
jgi:hypothetical protein